MINKTTLIIATFLISTSISSAATEDIKGTYSGEETLTVYDCAHKGVRKHKTTLTLKDVNGTSFKGHGSNADGKFTIKGEIDGNTVTTVVKGKNKWGQQWTATSNGELNGDAYTYSVKGKVLAPPNCKFTSEVKVEKK